MKGESGNERQREMNPEKVSDNNAEDRAVAKDAIATSFSRAWSSGSGESGYSDTTRGLIGNGPSGSRIQGCSFYHTR